MPSQVENGKAFEYAIALAYYDYLKSISVLTWLHEDSSLQNGRRCYEIQEDDKQNEFYLAAQKTIETMVAIEPGLVSAKNSSDFLSIRLASDAEGIIGDVRDVIFSRPNNSMGWEIGISAKNNHDAVKHSRLSPKIDFGNEWMDFPCSPNYFSEIQPVFDYLKSIKTNNPKTKWEDLGCSKSEDVYVPLLKAFRKEMLRLTKSNPIASANLLQYLIGRKPFYKVIKEDNKKIVVVKAFNIGGKLNQTVNGKKPIVKTDTIKLPTRVIELEFKEESDTTLMMILDEGWQISFRIHSASTYIENSLKFDIQLIGNPPILFTQHLF
ncbi:MAG: HaeIII family restriction endonuclease [Alphaproteobacteria bacterium]|jgi:hypothetical protein|nr:HaeIII family restriction endonuclease [Alphaproteobacteria bacterium]